VANFQLKLCPVLIGGTADSERKGNVVAGWGIYLSVFLRNGANLAKVFI